MVIKLTGKLFSPENVRVLMEIAEIVIEYKKRGLRMAVVVGGGETARRYISMASEAGVSLGWQDILGIGASRLNAMLFSSLLGDYAYYPVPTRIEEFIHAWNLDKIAVGGGLQPGQSNNAVAASLAELLNAELLINATTVDGVYDRDPRTDPNARLLKELTVKELKNVLSQSYTPGKYELLDPIAISIIERAKLSVVFINAFKPYMLKSVLSGERIYGSWVSP
ncbi:MAG: UMP kinase [Desulfurococcaceae archaeon]|nr:UMP kinase [Desulfurococcaceae archaeon]